MKKAFGVLFFGLAAGISGLLAILYKQKSGALDAAQMRIASMERRIGSLAASPVPAAAGQAGEVDALRARLVAQTAELEDLKRRLGETQAQLATATAVPSDQRGVANLAAVMADESVTDADSVPARLAGHSAELDDLRRQLQLETAWQAKAPALATAARRLENLPAAKIDLANRAATARVIPALLDEPQDLAQIPGIGAVFEQRLYNAGIGTFWEVAGLDDDQLRIMLKFEKLQETTVDLAAMRRAAAQLAEESGTQGYLWSGAGVDDLEPIKGIGKVYEQRLYDAGFRTYKALAEATPEQLADACQARSAVQPNYESWIAQARKLAGLES